MSGLEAVREALPESAKDVKLNLQSVLAESTLSPAQRWGVAVAAAATARNRPLLEAITSAALAETQAAVVDDALAAATLMAMNNVYYRFRHMVAKPAYAQKSARLRMNRLGKPATSRVDLELYSLAASAINGCEICVQSHEQAVLDGGLNEDQIHDAIRIAAVVHAAAVALESAVATTAA